MSKNDITGAEQKTKTTTNAYRDGWEKIFGKNQFKGEEYTLIVIDDPLTAVEWPEDETRIDVIGQNGNDGSAYEGAQDVSS